MTNKDLSVKRFAYLSAFVATVLIATALLVNKLLQVLDISGVGIVDLVERIGQLIAYVVMVVVAYFYVKTKRKPVWYIVYAVATTAILILAVLSFFG